MALSLDPSSRSALPPVAQFLAEAALQRQTTLLGPDKAVAAAPLPSTADPAASPPSPASPPATATPLPQPADKASISAQAREQLGAGFDPRRAAAEAAQASGARPSGSAARASTTVPLPVGAPAVAAPTSPAAPADWPAQGLGSPLMRLVSTVVAQITAASGTPQRVVSAQPWPVGLAQALEAGTLDPEQPPLQAWLVRQGTAQTSEGPRGFALTLRVPVHWLAAQPAASVPPAVASSGPLQVPFTGPAQALQSGVTALVLQGMEAAAPRTSALLVLDLQPQLATTVYGRDMLQQATGRLDPWTQMAVLQASGHVPREDERARNGASGLCDTVGCPYAARAACVQPFCMAMRGIPPPEPVGPAPLA